MSAQGSGDPAPAAEWFAWTLRITVFPSPPDEEFDSSGWWLELMEAPPDTHVSKPAMRVLQDEGRFLDGELSLALSPGRIDLVLQQDKSKMFEEDTVPTLGAMDEALAPFVELGERLIALESFPCIKRLAFAPVFLLPVDSHVSGYSRLNDYLPCVELDGENSSDFLYRINRPRPSSTGIDGLVINRVAQWSVFLFRREIFAQKNPAESLVKMEPLYACKVGLDINTSAEFEEDLPRDRHMAILAELVQMAKELCVNGDAP